MESAGVLLRLVAALLVFVGVVIVTAADYATGVGFAIALIGLTLSLGRS